LYHLKLLIPSLSKAVPCLQIDEPALPGKQQHELFCFPLINAVFACSLHPTSLFLSLLYSYFRMESEEPFVTAAQFTV
jgi:hypothetical protein